MTVNEDYAAVEPARTEIDALLGATLLEFGSPFCGHCMRAQPLLAEAMAKHATLRHIKIADGPARRLGRSFGVKLWPTLVFLRDGVEVARAVRPQEVDAIDDGLARITSDTHAADS